MVLLLLLAGCGDLTRREATYGPQLERNMNAIAPPEHRTIGHSVEGCPIETVTYGDSGHVVLVLGGIHGDEPKSVHLARRLVEELSSRHHHDATIVVVPVANPDGYRTRKRRNANGVDLNRNFPTENWEPGRRRSRFFAGDSPADQPETQALIRLIEEIRPVRILSIHSIGNRRFCVNYDGPAEELAGAFSEGNGYPLRAHIGYPTPGSLGTWAGIERRIPIITLELPSHLSPKQCWTDNKAPLLDFCRP